MAAALRVVSSSTEAPPPPKRRTSKKAPPESARDRRNRLARERRAAKKKADAEAAAAAEEAAAKAAAEKTRELSLMEAIESGDQLEILKAQRRDAARSLPTLTGQSLPAMHRQIAQLTEKISALESAKTEGTDIGDAIEAEDEEYDPDAE